MKTMSYKFLHNKERILELRESNPVIPRVLEKVLLGRKYFIVFDVIHEIKNDYVIIYLSPVEEDEIGT